MKRTINGFDFDWIGESTRIQAIRSTAPKHEYEFESSPDRKRLKRLVEYVPEVNVPGDPLLDAKQFDEEAWEAAKEYLRLENAA